MDVPLQCKNSERDISFLFFTVAPGRPILIVILVAQTYLMANPRLIFPSTICLTSLGPLRSQSILLVFFPRPPSPRASVKRPGMAEREPEAYEKRPRYLVLIIARHNCASVWRLLPTSSSFRRGLFTLWISPVAHNQPSTALKFDGARY